VVIAFDGVNEDGDDGAVEEIQRIDDGEESESVAGGGVGRRAGRVRHASGDYAAAGAPSNEKGARAQAVATAPGRKPGVLVGRFFPGLKAGAFTAICYSCRRDAPGMAKAPA
jgi:hypothetical protein